MSRRRRWTPRRLGGEVVMLLIAAIYLFPFYVFLTASFKTPEELTDSPLGLPSGPNVANYAEAWTEGSLGQAFVSSLTVTTLSVVMLIVCGSLAGYALARRIGRLSYGLYILFLLGLMIPMQLAMVPLYQFMRDVNLLETYTSLIIFEVGHQLPLVVFLYSGFIRALPRQYEEAAYVDGAGRLSAFARIVFPLMKPVTGTVVILTSIGIWNDFLTPMLYLDGTDQQTLPVAIYAFKGEFVTQWEVVFAGMALAILPILIVYFLLQKYVIHGFASGLKG